MDNPMVFKGESMKRRVNQAFQFYFTLEVATDGFLPLDEVKRPANLGPLTTISHAEKRRLRDFESPCLASCVYVQDSVQDLFLGEQEGPKPLLMNFCLLTCCCPLPCSLLRHFSIQRMSLLLRPSPLRRLNPHRPARRSGDRFGSDEWEGVRQAGRSRGVSRVGRRRLGRFFGWESLAVFGVKALRH